MGKHRQKNNHKAQPQSKSAKLVKSDKKIQQIDPDPRGWLKRALVKIQDNVAEHAQAIYQRHQKLMMNSRLKNEKQNMDKSLDLLRAEESTIREKLREIKQLQKATKSAKKYQQFNPIVKSNQQLKKLTKKYRKFKQDLLQKARIIKQQEQKYKQRQAQLKEEQKKSECEERRKKIEETLQKMAIRRKERLKEHQIQKMKLKQLEKQKLFEKMKQNFNKKMNDINEQKLLEYEKKKQAFNVDMSSLSQYEKKHDQQFEERQEKRSIRLVESRLLPSIHHYRSVFHENMLDRQAQEKQRLKQIKQRGKLLIEKHKKYQEYITQQFAPKVKERDSEDEVKEQEKVQPLEYKQMVQKGNQYLKQAHKQTLSIQRRKQLQKIRSLQLAIQNQRKVYPNYLSQVLKKSQTHKKLYNTYDGQLSRLKSIMSDKKLHKLDKIEQVKSTIQKMSYAYQPNKHNSEEQMMDKLNAKVKLLEMLQ